MINLIDEQTQLFNDILYRDYHKEWQKGRGDLELYLQGSCKQKCEYCYLAKHGEELYPSCVEDHQQIIEHLQIIMNWYVQNNFKCKISIFSGEWITTDLFHPVMDIIYNSLACASVRPKEIGIPDNMSWVENDKIVEEVQEIIDKFHELGISVYFSASVDGKYCEYGRKAHNDEFYNKLFKFLVKNGFNCHPMISSSNVKDWIENYKWWKTAPGYISKHYSMLEVRDETWTEQSIAEYILLADYVSDEEVISLIDPDNDDTKILALRKILYLINKDDPIEPFWGATPAACAPLFFTSGDDESKCSMQKALTVRLGDLAIPYCHRLSYEEQLLGRLVIENNTIAYAEPISVDRLIAKEHMRLTLNPYCEACPIIGICDNFCFGNAYENYRNMFIPVKENCDLQKAKATFLIKKYHAYGLFDYLDCVSELDDKSRAYLKKIVEVICNES